MFVGGKNSNGYPLKIFVRENAVQMFFNFPTKSISMYRAIFYDTLNW